MNGTNSHKKRMLLHRKRCVHIGIGSGTCLGLLLGVVLPAVAQDQPFSHIDDEVLHLTPITRQMDYARFQPTMGAFRTTGAHTDLFYFDSVLLPPASWVDNDSANVAKRHLATAAAIRHSVVPQSNPHGTISILLNGNGETPLDSDEGQAGFRSNGPSLPDGINPDSDFIVSGTWFMLPTLLLFSRKLRRTRQGDRHGV